MTFVLIVLFLSFWFYLIFAGADFGAGILEIFKGKEFQKEQESLVNKAMGPVWEANHIWLILAIVILFVGFPKIFKEISIVLHIPISAVLIGIVFRGSAFTFRHYDAIKDDSQIWYSRFFSWSSLWSTLWIGIIVGAIMEGEFSTSSTDFYDVYIAPWFNGFSLLVGIFLSAILSYITATFMIAEASLVREEVKAYLEQLYKRRAQISIAISILVGALIILYGQIYELYALKKFFSETSSILCFSASSFLLLIQYYAIRKGWLHWLKYLGVAQISLIFLGFVLNQFPYLVHSELPQHALSFYDSAASGPVMDQLSLALLIGTIVIFPPYIYLMKIFKEEALKK